jgi:hypothetical protein
MADSTKTIFWEAQSAKPRDHDGLNRAEAMAHGLQQQKGDWMQTQNDHSLKLNDNLVFTLVSTSHFVVEFATRAMRPTQDGKEYPWSARRNIWSRINYLENLPSVASGSSGSDDLSTPPSFTKVLKSKYEIHTSIHRCTLVK